MDSFHCYATSLGKLDHKKFNMVLIWKKNWGMETWIYLSKIIKQYNFHTFKWKIRMKTTYISYLTTYKSSLSFFSLSVYFSKHQQICNFEIGLTPSKLEYFFFRLSIDSVVIVFDPLILRIFNPCHVVTTFNGIS